MSHRTQIIKGEASSDPYSGSSLVPMLISGLVLTLIGMVVVLLLS
jgi:hypothetical protein